MQVDPSQMNGMHQQEDDDDDIYDIPDDASEQEGPRDLLDEEVSDDEEEDEDVDEEDEDEDVMIEEPSRRPSQSIATGTDTNDSIMRDAQPDHASAMQQGQQQVMNLEQQQALGQQDPANHEAQQQVARNAGDANGTANGRQNGANGRSNDIDDEPPLEGYERTDRIGQGAYGIVYRGIQRSTGSTVAIKRIPFAEATPEGGVPCNVIREISLLRELDHPNVVRLLDVNQAQPGELYLVFEYVAFDLKTFMDNQQTSREISERQGLPTPMVKNFMRQILQGVGVCHTYRVLHRDLKPHNLLISSDGRQLKLADFGLARLSGLPNGAYTYEVVTLWYRAPELLLGANRYSTAIDIWSIGCIFAEMASGMPLFPGRSDIDQLFKIFQRRGTPTSDVWQACTRLPYFNPEFPKWQPRPIRDLVSGESMNSPQATDLLEQLLQYDPDHRLVCKTALQHPYFFSQ